jgi:hypothetical protein
LAGIGSGPAGVGASFRALFAAPPIPGNAEAVPLKAIAPRIVEECIFETRISKEKKTTKEDAKVLMIQRSKRRSFDQFRTRILVV